MNTLETLKPKNKSRIFDLVEETGMDMSDWISSAKNPKKISANPKYCYEWSYVAPDRFVVLNLWYEQLNEEDGIIFCDPDMTERIPVLQFVKKNGPQTCRAKQFQSTLKLASNQKLPVRVIVNDGIRQSSTNPSAKPSRVIRRKLDSEFWHIRNDENTADTYRIVRGSITHPHFVDQFSSREVALEPPKSHDTFGKAFDRNPKVRLDALTRASGNCEFCGSQGFQTHDGRIYLETHHILPLSKDGPDHISNVAALCATHHREAHHGDRRDDIFEFLKLKITDKYQR